VVNVPALHVRVPGFNPLDDGFVLSPFLKRYESRGSYICVAVIISTAKFSCNFNVCSTLCKQAGSDSASAQDAIDYIDEGCKRQNN